MNKTFRKILLTALSFAFMMTLTFGFALFGSSSQQISAYAATDRTITQYVDFSSVDCSGTQIYEKTPLGYLKNRITVSSVFYVGSSFTVGVLQPDEFELSVSVKYYTGNEGNLTEHSLDYSEDTDLPFDKLPVNAVITFNIGVPSGFLNDGVIPTPDIKSFDVSDGITVLTEEPDYTDLRYEVKAGETIFTTTPLKNSTNYDFLSKINIYGTLDEEEVLVMPELISDVKVLSNGGNLISGNSNQVQLTYKGQTFSRDDVEAEVRSVESISLNVDTTRAVKSGTYWYIKSDNTFIKNADCSEYSVGSLSFMNPDDDSTYYAFIAGMDTAVVPELLNLYINYTDGESELVSRGNYNISQSIPDESSAGKAVFGVNYSIGASSYSASLTVDVPAKKVLSLTADFEQNGVEYYPSLTDGAGNKFTNITDLIRSGTGTNGNTAELTVYGVQNNGRKAVIYNYSLDGDLSSTVTPDENGKYKSSVNITYTLDRNITGTFEIETTYESITSVSFSNRSSITPQIALSQLIPVNIFINWGYSNGTTSSDYELVDGNGAEGWIESGIGRYKVYYYSAENYTAIPSDKVNNAEYLLNETNHNNGNLGHIVKQNSYVRIIFVIDKNNEGQTETVAVGRDFMLSSTLVSQIEASYIQFNTSAEKWDKLPEAVINNSANNSANFGVAKEISGFRLGTSEALDVGAYLGFVTGEGVVTNEFGVTFLYTKNGNELSADNDDIKIVEGTDGKYYFVVYNVGTYRVYLNLDPNGNYRWRDGVSPAINVSGNLYKIYLEFEVTPMDGSVEFVIDDYAASDDGKLKAHSYLYGSTLGDGVGYKVTYTPNGEGLDSVVYTYPEEENGEINGDRIKIYYYGTLSNGKYVSEQYIDPNNPDSYPRLPGTYHAYAVVEAFGNYASSRNWDVCHFEIIKHSVKLTVSNNQTEFDNNTHNPESYSLSLLDGNGKIAYSTSDEYSSASGWYFAILNDDGSIKEKLSKAPEYINVGEYRVGIVLSEYWSDRYDWDYSETTGTPVDGKNILGYYSDYYSVLVSYRITKYESNKLSGSIDGWEYKKYDTTDNSPSIDASSLKFSDLGNVSGTQYNLAYVKEKSDWDKTEDVKAYLDGVLASDNVISENTLNDLDAGTYYLFVYNIGDGRLDGAVSEYSSEAYANYNFCYSFIELKVSKQIITNVTAPDDVTYSGENIREELGNFTMYDGNTIYSITSVVASNTSSYGQDKISYVGKYVTVLYAGTYTIELTISDGYANNYAWTSGGNSLKVVWTVNRASVVKPEIEKELTFVYNGLNGVITAQAKQGGDWVDVTSLDDVVNKKFSIVDGATGYHVDKYEIIFELDNNYYWSDVNGSSPDSDLERQYNVKWEIVPQKIEKIVADGKEYTYKGSNADGRYPIEIGKDIFDSRFMSATLNAVSATDVTLQVGSGKACNLLIDEDKITLSANLAGTYTVTIGLKEGFEKDFVLTDGSAVSYTVVYVIKQKEITVNWGENLTFTYDGEEHSLAPQADGAVNEEVLSLVSATTHKLVYGVKTPLGENEKAIAVGTYYTTVSNITSGSYSNNSDLAVSGTLYIADNYILSGTLENEFTIGSATVDRPILKGGVDGALSVVYNGQAYRFIDYILNYADISTLVVIKSGDLTGEGVAFINVKWSDDNKQALAYEITVSINDKDNYVWTEGGTDDITFSFTVTPKLISEVQLSGENGTYEVDYNAEYQYFSNGISNYNDIKEYIAIDDGVKCDVYNNNGEVGTYTVTVGLNNNNYAWATTGDSYDVEAKPYYFKIRPVNLDVTWSDLEQVYGNDDYSAKELAPNVVLANFGGKDADLVTISFVLTVSDQNTGTLTLGENATTASQAGYYDVKVNAISDSKAFNYTINDNKALFTILKRAIEQPTDGSFAESYVFNNTLQTFEVSGFNEQLMQVEIGNAVDPYGNAFTETELKDGYSTTVSGNVVSISALHAGSYDFKITLKDTNNFCWENGIADNKPWSDVQPSGLKAFVINPLEVKAPVIQRGIERDTENQQPQNRYPEFDGLNADNTLLLQTENSELKVKAQITLPTSASAVGQYPVKITLTPDEAQGFAKDYVLISSGDEGEKASMESLHIDADVIVSSSDEISITLYYMVTNGTFKLEFKALSWTYGSTPEEAIFTRIDALPDNYGSENEANRSVTYYIWLNEDWEEVSSGNLIDNKNYSQTAGEKYNPQNYPYIVGKYRAEIKYTYPKGDNALYQAEQYFYAEFEISALALEVVWNSDNVIYTYNTEGQIVGAQVTVLTKIDGKVTGDKIELTVSLNGTYDHVDGEGKPTYAGNYDVVAAVNEAISTGFENYTLTNTTSTFEIKKLEVTLTAGDASHVYGEKELVGGVDIAEKTGITESENSFLDGASVSNFKVYARLADGELVAYNTVKGSYSTVITPINGGIYVNYEITYIAGIFTVEAKEIAIVWEYADTTFTYDGTNQYDKNKADFVYFIDIDGNKIVLTPEVSGKGSAFVNAGDYTFTINDGSYPANFDLKTNYSIPANNTHDFTMAKRAVSIVADDVTTVYGTLAEYLTWSYIEGTTDLNKFVYEDDANLFTVGTNALKKDKPTITTRYTYIIYDEVEQSGTVELDNYTVTVANGKYTIEKKVLTKNDIKWDDNVKFVYDGTNQNESEKINKIAYFIDAVTGETKYMSVHAISGERDYTSTREFINATDSNNQTINYLLYIYALSDDDDACYSLPAAPVGGATGSDDFLNGRMHTVTMSKRAVSIEVVSVDNHVYGNEIVASELKWQYTDGNELEFVNGFDKNFTVKTTVNEKSDVGTYKGELVLYYGNVEFTDGYVLQNYEVNFKNGDITVIQREIEVSVSNVTTKYGEAFKQPSASLIEGSLLLVNGHNNDDVFTLTTEAITQNGEALKAANSDGYEIYLTLINANYKVIFENQTAANVGDVINNVALYIIEQSQISVEKSDYTADYSGLDQIDSILAKFTASYFTNVTGAGIKSVSPANTVTDVTNNNIKWEYRLNGSAEWSTAKPVIKNAATYNLYYRVSADNHFAAEGEIEVIINKVTVTVSANATIYYGQNEPHGEGVYTATNSGVDYTLTFNGFVNSEKLKDVDLNENSNVYIATVYTVGSKAGEYEVDTFTHNFTCTNYTFVADLNSSKVVVERLPITVEIISNISNKYYFNQVVGKETPADLAKIGENYTITVEKGGNTITDIKGNDISSVYSGDLEGTLQKIFVLESAALVDDVTNVVGAYDITLSVNGDYGNKYEINFVTNGYKYSITPADIWVDSGLHGYGSRNTMTYDGEAHFAVHGDHTEIDTSYIPDETAKTYAKANGGNEAVWSYYLYKKTSDSDTGLSESQLAATIFVSEMPKVEDAGEYIVYYRIEAGNHATHEGSVVCKISKADNEWITEYSIKSTTQNEGTGNTWIYGAYEAQNNPQGYHSQDNMATLPVPKFNKGANGAIVNTVVKIYRVENEVYTLIATYDCDENGYAISWLAQQSDKTVEMHGVQVTLLNGATLDAGEYIVKYSMPASENFNEIAEKTATSTIRVGKKTLSVATEKGIEIKYGTTIEANYFDDKFTCTGFANAETWQDVYGESLPTFSVHKKNSDGTIGAVYEPGNDYGYVGTYAVDMRTGELSSNNYILKPSENIGTLEIIKLNITVYIDPISYFYDLNKSIGSEDLIENPASLYDLLRKTGGDNFFLWQGNWENFVTLRTNGFIYDDDGNVISTNHVGTYAIYGVANENSNGRNYNITFEGNWSGSVQDDEFNNSEYYNCAGTLTIKQALLNVNFFEDEECTTAFDVTATRYYNGEYYTVFAKNAAVNSTAQVSFSAKYYENIGNETNALAQAPINAGFYTVDFIVLNETYNDYYFSGDKVKFTILPKEIYVDMRIINDGKDVTGESTLYYNRNYYLVKVDFSESDIINTDNKPNDRELLENSVVYTYVNASQTTLSPNEYPLHAGNYIGSATTTYGNYVIKVKNTQTGSISDPEISFRISPQVLVSPVVSGSSLTTASSDYSGETQTATVANFTNLQDKWYENGYVLSLELTYKDSNGNVSLLGYGDAFNFDETFSFDMLEAGEYRAKFTINYTADYWWSGDSTNAVREVVFTVNRINLYVKASNTNIVYGEEFDTLKVSITEHLIFDGFAEADKANLGDLVLDGITYRASNSIDVYTVDSLDFNSTKTSKAGSTYSIEIAGISSNNYNVFYTDRNSYRGTLTVVKRNLTVEISDTTNEYGTVGAEYDKTLAVTDGSLRNGECGAYELYQALKVTYPEYNEFANVGTYAITISDYANDNYSVTWVGSWENGKAGTLTVTKATLTYTVIAKDGFDGIVATDNTDFTLVYGTDYNIYNKDNLGQDLPFDHSALSVIASGWKESEGNRPAPSGKYVFTTSKLVSGVETLESYTIGGSISGDKFKVGLVLGEDGVYFENYDIKVEKATMTVVSRSITLNETAEREFEANDDYSVRELPVDWTDGDRISLLEFANTIEGYAPTYTTVYSGSSLSANGIPTRAGEYDVTVTLSKNANGEYDYVFVGGISVQVEYTINKRVLEIAWSNATPVWNDGETVTVYVSGYDNEIMSYSSYTFGGAIQPDGCRMVDGKLTAFVNSIGSGSILITINDKYTNDYILSNPRTSITGTGLSISFTSVAIGVNFTITISGWTYGGDVQAPVPHSTVLSDDVLNNAAIAYTYASLAGIEVPDNGILTNEQIAQLATKFSPAAPTVAGKYVVRGILPEGDGYGVTTAYAIFDVAKVKVAKPSFDDGEFTDRKTQAYAVGMLTANIYADNTSAIVINYSGTSILSDSGYIITAVGVSSNEVSFTLRDSVNYEWDNTTESTVTLIWVIEKGVTVISDFEAIDGIIYGNEYSFEATANYGEIYYSYALKGTLTSPEQVQNWTVNLPKHAGTYYIRASVDPTDNYGGAEEYVEILISPKNIKISAVGVSVEYGTQLSDVRLDYKLIDELVEGDEASDVIVGSPIYRDEYVAGKGVGNYPITLSGVGTLQANDYTFEVDNSEEVYITVTPRTVTVTLKNQTSVYNGEKVVPNSGSAYWTAENKFGDDILGIKIDIVGAGIEADSYTIVGSADDTVEGNANENYSFEFVDGVYEITRLVLSFDGTRISGTYTFRGKQTAPTESEGGVKIHYTIDGVEYEYGASDSYKFEDSLYIRYSGYSNGNVSYAQDGAVPFEAGSYVATFMSGSTQNIVISGNSYVPFNIDKKTVAGDLLYTKLENVLNVEYTGSPISADADAIESVSEELYGIENLYSVAVTPNTNAGVYTEAITLTLLPEAFNNYKWERYEVSSRNLTFTITQAKNNASLTLNGIDKVEVVYFGGMLSTVDNVEFTAKFGRNSSFVHMISRAEDPDDESAYEMLLTSADLQEYAAVGNYWYKIMIPETANYTSAVTNYIRYVVTPRSISVTLNGGNAFVGGIYGGNSTAVPYEIKDEAASGASALRAEEFASIVRQVSLNFYYYGTAFDGTVYTSDNSVIPSLAGVYTVCAVLAGDVLSRNFVLVSDATTQYSINRAEVFVNNNAILSYDYNGQPQFVSSSVNHSGNPDYGTYYYVTADDDVSYIEAGEYSFNVTLCDVNNYYWRIYGDSTATTENVNKSRPLTFRINTVNIIGVEFTNFNFTVNGENRTVADGIGWTYLDTVTNLTGDVKVTVRANGVDVVLSDTFALGDDFRLEYGGDDRTTYTTAVPTLAGKYLVRAFVARTVNFNNSYASDGISFIIDKYALSAPELVLDDSNQTYTGSILEAKFDETFDFARMTTSGDILNQPVDSRNLKVFVTNAGEYHFHVVLRDTDNFKWNAAANADDIGVEIVWTVNKAKNEISGFDNVNTTYGSVNAFTAKAKFDEVKYSYTDENGVSSTDRPINVGTYTVTATVDGNDNYDTVSLTGTLVIKKATLTIRANNTSVTYGDAFVNAGYTIVRTGFKYQDDESNIGIKGLPEYGTNYVVGSRVGSYAIEITGVGTLTADNYEFVASEISGTLTVTAKTIVINIKNQSSVYDGKNPVLDSSSDSWELATGYELLDGDVLQVILSRENDNVYDADNYFISGSLAAPDENNSNANYSAIFRPGIFTINQKQIIISGVNVRSDMYYGDADDATFKVEGESTAYKAEYIVLADGQLYNAVRLSNGAVAQISYQSMSGGLETFVKPTQAGVYLVTVKLVSYGLHAANKNYVLSGDTSTNYVIAKAEIDGSQIEERAKELGLLTLTYNGSEQRISAENLAKIAQLSKDYFVAGEGDTLFTARSESGINTGYYVVTLTISDKYFNNYKWKSVEIADRNINFEIVKYTQNDASIEYDYEYENDTLVWEYNGAEALSSIMDHIVINGINFGRDMIDFMYAPVIDGVVGEYTNVSPSRAGVYKAYAYVTDNDNFNGFTTNEVTFEILPRKIYAQVVENGGIYDGNVTAAEASIFALNGNTLPDASLLRLVDYQVLYYGTSNDGSWSYTRDNPSQIAPRKAGNYSVLVRLSNSAVNSNFSFVDESGNMIDGVEGNFLIRKALINPKTVVMTSLTYNGNAQYASLAFANDGGIGVLYNLAQDISATNAGTYEIVMQIIDGYNYEWSDTNSDETQIEWTIARYRLTKPGETGLIIENGDESYSFIPSGFDDTRMTVSGNTAYDNGTYTLIISIKDKANYEWSDGSDEDIEISWTLDKNVSGAFIVLTVVFSVLLVIAAGAFIYMMILKNKSEKEEQQAEEV